MEEQDTHSSAEDSDSTAFTDKLKPPGNELIEIECPRFFSDNVNQTYITPKGAVGDQSTLEKLREGMAIMVTQTFLKQKYCTDECTHHKFKDESDDPNDVCLVAANKFFTIMSQPEWDLDVDCLKIQGCGPKSLKLEVFYKYDVEKNTIELGTRGDLMTRLHPHEEMYILYHKAVDDLTNKGLVAMTCDPPTRPGHQCLNPRHMLQLKKPEFKKAAKSSGGVRHPPTAPRDGPSYLAARKRCDDERAAAASAAVPDAAADAPSRFSNGAGPSQ